MRKPVLHGRDHLPGGADPIPGLENCLGGNTGLRVHIHQAVTGYNDGGLIYFGGLNLTQVSDAAASDGVAVKWTAPSYANFAAVYADVGAGMDKYDWQPTFADTPFLDGAVDLPGKIMVTCRVRGTDAGTTYRLTFEPSPNTDPNTSISIVDGGTAESNPSAVTGELFNTLTWSGTTDYVNLTWTIDYVPDSIAAPDFYFFGWYVSGGSGDLLLDKITMTWPF